MALRILQRTFITKPVKSLCKFASQVQTQPSSEKSTTEKPAAEKETSEEPATNLSELKTRWPSNFTQTEEVRPPVINESNPVNHNESHVGYFYRVSHETYNRLYILGGYPKLFLKQREVFADTLVMVRKPALEIINNLKNTDFSKPAVRQVLYGRFGCGKSMTLAHVLHYAAVENFLLVHVPWINKFMRMVVSAQPSVFREGMLDVPHEGSVWLRNFKLQNKELISNPDFVTTNHHQFTDRESTQKGTQMLELVDYGINRNLFSNMVIDILLREIKEYTNKGLFKTLVMVDGFNGFLQEFIMNQKRIISKGKFSLTPSFFEITNFDWCNAAIVVSVDPHVHAKSEEKLYKPYEVLGKVGWEHLDPFVPIQVGDYTNFEAQNVIELYVQKAWLNNPAAKTKEGREELITLSGRNPLQLLKVCDPL